MADPVGSSDGGYKIENGTWYLDYRSWTDPIPEGVNCVNLFEGKLDIVNGQYTIDGLNSLQVNQLKTFIEECHNHVPPIAVKVSLGGAGGQTVYNNTWDQLMNPDGTANPTAIQGFAAGMASFCHEYGIDGIDFDYGTSPETGSYGFKIKKIPINKKYMIIGGITLALVAVAVVGSIYLKKRQEKKP